MRFIQKLVYEIVRLILQIAQVFAQKQLKQKVVSLMILHKRSVVGTGENAMIIVEDMVFWAWY